MLGRQCYINTNDFWLNSTDYTDSYYAGGKSTGLTVGSVRAAAGNTNHDGGYSKEVAIDFGKTVGDNASVEGFTSKGFVRWRFDAAGVSALTDKDGYNPYGNNENIRYTAGVTFSKRECTLAACRVLQVLASKNDAQGNPVGTYVIVDRPDLLSAV